MESLSWMSVLFYCLFCTFVYYQQLHIRHFQGASKAFELLLSLSAFAGLITGVVYLVYYGWTVVWWAPMVIFVIGILFTFIGVFIEQLLGKLTLSFLGFIGWPVCAYLMFHYVPEVKLTLPTDVALTAPLSFGATVRSWPTAVAYTVGCGQGGESGSILRTPYCKAVPHHHG
jgi:hypothetical protein